MAGTCWSLIRLDYVGLCTARPGWSGTGQCWSRARPGGCWCSCCSRCSRRWTPPPSPLRPYSCPCRRTPGLSTSPLETWILNLAPRYHKSDIKKATMMIKMTAIMIKMITMMIRMIKVITMMIKMIKQEPHLFHILHLDPWRSVAASRLSNQVQDWVCHLATSYHQQSHLAKHCQHLITNKVFLLSIISSQPYVE